MLPVSIILFGHGVGGGGVGGGGQFGGSGGGQVRVGGGGGVEHGLENLGVRVHQSQHYVQQLKRGEKVKRSTCCCKASY